MSISLNWCNFINFLVKVSNLFIVNIVHVEEYDRNCVEYNTATDNEVHERGANLKNQFFNLIYN
jgi:hypothetical protein